MSTTPLTSTVAMQVLSYLPEVPVGTITVNVTWYNFGPLTTAFKAPASCSSEIPGLVTVINNTDSEYWNASLRMNCDKLNGFFPTQLSCQPSAQFYESLVRSGDINAVQSWYLSPGILCPPGYSTVEAYTLSPSNVSATATITTGALYRTTRTHVFCCPRYGPKMHCLLHVPQ